MPSTQPSRTRRPTRLIAAVTALALLTGGYTVYDRLAPRPVAAATAVTTAEAQIGSITSTVSATGNVVAPVQAKLTFPSAGLLIELLAKVGDIVAAGQPLARIDTAALQVSRAQAQASYTSALAAYEKTIVGAQASLDALLNPRPEDVAAAQQTIDQAQASIDKLLNGNQYDVKQAQVSLTQAQLSLTETQKGAAAYEIAAAQANVDQAKAALDQAKINLAGATLTAPYAATVSATGAAAGEQVGASTAVVTLVDASQLRVDVSVDETSVAKLTVGQQANVAFEALSGLRIGGTVTAIAPVATITNGVVTYAVQIELNAPQAQTAGVRAGMTATASIVADSRQNVLVVPNRAIKTQGQTTTVQVQTAAGATEARQVRVGLSNDQMTEITSGLQAGEKVVITGTTTAVTGLPGVAGSGIPGAGVPGLGVGAIR